MSRNSVLEAPSSRPHGRSRALLACPGDPSAGLNRRLGPLEALSRGGEAGPRDRIGLRPWRGASLKSDGPLKATLDGRSSKKGLLGGDPVAAWEPLRAGLHLTQHPIFEFLVHHFGRLEAELTERPCRPPLGLPVQPVLPVVSRWAWRLGDQQPRSDLQQGGGALGQHGGATERSGQHAVEPSTEVWIPATDFGPFLHNGDSPVEVQALYRPSKEGGAPGVGLNQDQHGCRPFRRHHQSGETTARTQVGQPGRAPGEQTPADGAKALGMPNLRLQWPRAQESQGAGVRQELVQKGGGVTPVVGAGHRRPVSPRVR
jgi:hypothetical protein